MTKDIGISGYAFSCNRSRRDVRRLTIGQHDLPLHLRYNNQQSLSVLHLHKQ